MFRIPIFEEFRKIGDIAKLFVIISVLCVFCGQSKLSSYVPHMMIVLLVIALYYSNIHGSGRGIRLNLRYKFHLLIMFEIVIFMAFQIYTVSVNPARTLVYCRRYFLYAMLLTIILATNTSISIIRISENYALLAGLTSVVDTIISGSPSGGLYGSYHGAGMMMSIACCMFSIDYFTLRRSRWTLAKYVFSLGCVVLTTKRMFLLISVIGLLFAFILTTDRKKEIRILRALLIITAIGIVLFVSVPQARIVFTRLYILLTAEDMSVALSGRNILWDMAMQIFYDNKAFGIGFSNFIDYSGMYYSNAWAGLYHTHNIYYGLLCETGIVGVFSFTILFLSGLVLALQTRKRCKKINDSKLEYIILISIIIQFWFLVYGFSGNGIYDANEFFAYVLSILLLNSVRYELDNQTI